MKRLVVVESPTKARTIRKFLPADAYQIEACMGHVRDLPSSAAEIPESVKKEKWSRLGVNVNDGFTPLYIVPPEKKKVVRELKKALKDADELYVATDEDREGESIGWHLLQVLEPKVPVRRMVFHEITREAIERAVEQTREIDHRLVDAQETRRILDRLVGYTISPLLWKKIRPKLSAGRVQSVAVRMLVGREQERLDFIPAGYWDLKATLAQDSQAFEAKMTHLGEERLATSRDFDENTGTLKDGTDGVLVLKEADARRLAQTLPGADWRVAEVETKERTRKPAAPFITSTLQQEANRKLGLSARRTMQIAQALYEQGHITYMRTDSPTLSGEAIGAARSAVEKRYGKNYLSPSPRQYGGKVRNAQEAHEAIRPAGTAMKTQRELGLTGLDGKLYDLIWKRTVASQMANAKLLATRADITATAGDEVATFRANGQTVAFPGFFRAYVEGSDDPNAALDDRDNPLPELSQGDTPACQEVEPLGHETRPPARFTDATIVRALESEGIGRPSTYASIIDTIINRGYVRRQGNQLIPTFTAFATNNLLEQHFSRLVDSEFTARLENALDDIADGDAKARPYLDDFYHGDDGLEARVTDGLDKVDARGVSTLEHFKWTPFLVRVGKYGPYAEGEIDGETQTASLPNDVAPADVTREALETLVRESNSEQMLGIHPDADQPVFLKSGPYGPYVQLGDDEQEGKPKRTSLPKGLERRDVTFEIAQSLLELPKTLGAHPTDGADIKANIGRYGPYVQHHRTFASLKKEDDILNIELPRALELLAEKTKKNEPLRTLGAHPDSGEPIGVYEGRYGPYVKHKRINATLPKGTAIDEVTLEQAVTLINEKAAKKGKKKGGRKKKAKA
ncbi:MAG: type I DNA topoisomerase [Bacteroidota bacterium]